jgi:hypothetical protein
MVASLTENTIMVKDFKKPKIKIVKSSLPKVVFDRVVKLNNPLKKYYEYGKIVKRMNIDYSFLLKV